ncbi:MAG TPA: uracil-DNA glycosylase [Burkholderiaceae bacterium]|nr:uracil-DNA glycosylase [Burkholderiaceae bacterium]
MTQSYSHRPGECEGARLARSQPILLSTPLAAHFDALPPPWRAASAPFVRSGAFEALCRFVDDRVKAGATVYPPRPLSALDGALPSAVRVVIVGQDPYHGAGQAHGLAFSVPEGVPPPPSLRNILAEVARDFGCAPPGSVCLQRWARQGVLLLNTVLTVEQDKPASHARHGWEQFTSGLIESLAGEPSSKVFLLWGAHAQSLQPAIARAGDAHRVLLANHPSPLSARRGPVPFVGCSHFSAANEFLIEHGRGAIDWCASG